MQTRKENVDKLGLIKIKNNQSSKSNVKDLPGGTVVKNPPANSGHTGLSPVPGRFHMPRP